MTEADLLDALRAAYTRTDEEPEDVYTTGDICRILGRGTHYVRPMIRDLITKGQVECVKVKRDGIDGRVTLVPAYRFKVAA